MAHGPHTHGKREHIRREAVRIPAHYLRGGPPTGPFLVPSQVLSAGEGNGKAKIAQLWSEVRVCEEDVVWLEVAVEEAKGVYVLTCGGEAAGDGVVVRGSEGGRERREEETMEVTVDPFKDEGE